MKLFSSSVKPTHTNSTHNIIQVEAFEEIFFDVFEIEINKDKYPVEKISEYEGNPVVSIPVVLEGVEVFYPFVLLKGKFEVLFNEDNTLEKAYPGCGLDLIKESPIVSPSEPKMEEAPEGHLIETKIIRLSDTKKNILEQINRAKNNAQKQIIAFRSQKTQEATKKIEESNKMLKKTLDAARDTLVDEFVSISNKIKEELIDINSKKYLELKETLDNKIQFISEDLEETLKDDFTKSSELFDLNIKKLIMEMYSSLVMPKVTDELKTIALDIVEKVDKIEQVLDTKLDTKAEKTLVEGVSKELDAIRDANIELNNTINKGVNRALSRVGNVKTQIDTLSEALETKISEAISNISTYYSDQIAELSDNTFNLTEESRKYFTSLINESKRNLLEEIQKIKTETPIEYVIESKRGAEKVDLSSLKKEYDKIISDKFSNEVVNLRKYISVYASGGGTNSVQYQDGGTMNGNLTIVGAISAGSYLGLPGGGSDDVAVSTKVRSSSASWDSTYNTVGANSASWGLGGGGGEFLPLSGGNLTGVLSSNSSAIFYNLSESYPTLLKLDQTIVQTISGGIPLLDSNHAKFSLDHQIIDKEYADSLAGGGMRSWFFTTSASDIAGVYVATPTLPSRLAQTLTTTASSGETIIASFITPLSTVEYRVVDGSRFFYFTAKTSNDSKSQNLRGYVYTTDLSGGNEQLLRSSNLTPPITTADSVYFSNVWGNALLIKTTMRIKFVLSVIKESGGPDTTITLTVEDDTFSRLDVPSPVGVTDLTGVLHLDQTIPQNIISGAPNFTEGINVGTSNQFIVNNSGNIITTGSLSSNSSGNFLTLSANTATFNTISAATYLGIIDLDNYLPLTGGTLNGNLNIQGSLSATNTIYGNTQMGIDINRCGFINRTDTKIAFNDTTYIFTLSCLGTNWSYYRSGIRNTITGTKTLSVSPLADTTFHYVVLDSNDGIITQSTSPWTLLDSKIPIATIYWDSRLTPKYILADERHTCLIDRNVHYHEHVTEGTQCINRGTVFGQTIGITAADRLDTAKSFGLSGVIIADEDLTISLAGLPDPASGTSPYYIVYRNGSLTEWTWKTSNVPFPYSGTGYIQYDAAATGNLSAATTQNQYVNSYLFVTNNVINNEVSPDITTSPLAYMIIPGRALHANTTAAYAESFALFNMAGLPAGEGVAIYQFTWLTNNTAGNITTNPGRCTLNRVAQITENVISSTIASTVNHNALAGLQGGLTSEYYHLNSSQYANFNKKFVQINGDLRGAYGTSPYWKMLDMETATEIFPSGITVTSIYAKCSEVDPTTELNASIKYCDAQELSSFPGANPVNISTFITTTGNYSETGLLSSIPTNKIVYLEMNANPTDYPVTWSITMNYNVN